jgi:hypothetical protein
MDKKNSKLITKVLENVEPIIFPLTKIVGNVIPINELINKAYGSSREQCFLPNTEDEKVWRDYSFLKKFKVSINAPDFTYINNIIEKFLIDKTNVNIVKDFCVCAQDSKKICKCNMFAEIGIVRLFYFQYLLSRKFSGEGKTKIQIEDVVTSLIQETNENKEQAIEQEEKENDIKKIHTLNELKTLLSKITKDSFISKINFESADNFKNDENFKKTGIKKGDFLKLIFLKSNELETFINNHVKEIKYSNEYIEEFELPDYLTNTKLTLNCQNLKKVYIYDKNQITNLEALKAKGVNIQSSKKSNLENLINFLFNRIIKDEFQIEGNKKKELAIKQFLNKANKSEQINKYEIILEFFKLEQNKLKILNDYFERDIKIIKNTFNIIKNLSNSNTDESLIDKYILLKRNQNRLIKQRKEELFNYINLTTNSKTDIQTFDKLERLYQIKPEKTKLIKFMKNSEEEEKNAEKIEDFLLQFANNQIKYFKDCLNNQIYSNELEKDSELKELNDKLKFKLYRLKDLNKNIIPFCKKTMATYLLLNKYIVTHSTDFSKEFLQNLTAINIYINTKDKKQDSIINMLYESYRELASKEEYQEKIKTDIRLTKLNQTLCELFTGDYPNILSFFQIHEAYADLFSYIKNEDGFSEELSKTTFVENGIEFANFISQYYVKYYEFLLTNEEYQKQIKNNKNASYINDNLELSLSELKHPRTSWCLETYELCLNLFNSINNKDVFSKKFKEEAKQILSGGEDMKLNLISILTLLKQSNNEINTKTTELKDFFSKLAIEKNFSPEDIESFCTIKKQENQVQEEKEQDLINKLITDYIDNNNIEDNFLQKIDSSLRNFFNNEDRYDSFSQTNYGEPDIGQFNYYLKPELQSIITELKAIHNPDSKIAKDTLKECKLCFENSYKILEAQWSEYLQDKYGYDNERKMYMKKQLIKKTIKTLEDKLQLNCSQKDKKKLKKYINLKKEQLYQFNINKEKLKDEIELLKQQKKTTRSKESIKEINKYIAAKQQKISELDINSIGFIKKIINKIKSEPESKLEQWIQQKYGEDLKKSINELIFLSTSDTAPKLNESLFTQWDEFIKNMQENEKENIEIFNTLIKIEKEREKTGKNKIERNNLFCPARMEELAYFANKKFLTKLNKNLEKKYLLVQNQSKKPDQNSLDRTKQEFHNPKLYYGLGLNMDWAIERKLDNKIIITAKITKDPEEHSAVGEYNKRHPNNKVQKGTIIVYTINSQESSITDEQILTILRNQGINNGKKNVLKDITMEIFNRDGGSKKETVIFPKLHENKENKLQLCNQETILEKVSQRLSSLSLISN